MLPSLQLGPCHRLENFLGAQDNELQMIVRAHECVMDGFERFAQGHLITLFSATNYCGTANNAGAILVRSNRPGDFHAAGHSLQPAGIQAPQFDPISDALTPRRVLLWDF